MAEVRIIVSLLSGAVQTGLTKIRAQFSQLRHELSGELGSFLALGGLITGIEKLIERGTELSNVSRRFGAPAKELQRVTNAGRENGAQIEDVARSWNKLAVNQQKAIAGNEEMRNAFAKLGIPMEEVAKMSVDQLFYRVADATASAEDRGKAYAAVVQIMGRNAGLLYSTLEKGSGAIKAQGDEIGIMTDNTIESLHKIHIQFERLKQTLFIYGGSIIIFFKNLGESLGAVVGEIGNQLGLVIGLYKGAATAIVNLGKGLLKGRLTLDTKDFSAALDDVKRHFGQKGILGDLEQIWKGDKTDHEERKPKPPIDLEATDSEKSSAEKLITLREQLAELERKTSNDELSAQEKINALVAQRKALLAEAAKEDDPEKKLQLQVDAAKVNQELVNAQQAAAKEIEAAQDKLTKAQEDADYSALKTDAQRKDFLVSQIDKLQTLINAETDAAEKLKLQTDQAEQKKKLEELVKKEAEAPRISSNSLRRIGGQQDGGFAVGGVGDKLLNEARDTNKTLKEIRDKINNGGSGGPNMQ